MLGRFLEYSIPTPDIRASLEFYERLGFSQAEVGEAVAHPYAVVTDGRIHLGLHGTDDLQPALTFVKPGLLQHLAAFEAQGLNFDSRRLGDDEFNELAWAAPAGPRIRLIEARTFSPAKRKPTDTSLCGYFTELALPAAEPGAAKDYWERLGFVGIDELDSFPARISCTSDSIDIGLYDRASMPLAGLVFDAGDLGATLARLAAAGFATAARLPPAWRARQAGLLMAPEGTALLLLPGGGS